MPTCQPVIYQLKVVLQGISPMIWRRLLIRADTTITDLHYIDYDPHKDYPLCISGRRACPPEDCGGPWRFMALRQHYSLIQIMERCFEIIEDTELEDHVEELYTLRYWLNVDRFDRKAVNKRLFDYARGENVFDWI